MLKSQFIERVPKKFIYAGDASINTMVIPVYTLGRKKTIAEKYNQTYHQIEPQSFEDDEFAQAKSCVDDILRRLLHLYNRGSVASVVTGIYRSIL